MEVCDWDGLWKPLDPGCLSGIACKDNPYGSYIPYCMAVPAPPDGGHPPGHTCSVYGQYTCFTDKTGHQGIWICDLSNQLQVETCCHHSHINRWGNSTALLPKISLEIASLQSIHNMTKRRSPAGFSFLLLIRLLIPLYISYGVLACPAHATADCLHENIKNVATPIWESSLVSCRAFPSSLPVSELRETIVSESGRISALFKTSSAHLLRTESTNTRHPPYSYWAVTCS